ncbi:tetratricopeptide repeat protein [Sneathiella sp. CAU 1612]|uniref:Tetratricopeptide repeat protein n=2 Tax=Sneathiella sedimenti TaxID=2816034 RepID=A0ABS3F0Z8_9PROT|nr:tetratricopeptide repeat protein [Sneathiella sedimenti]
MTEMAGAGVSKFKLVWGGFILAAALGACAANSASSERHALPDSFQDAGGTAEMFPSSYLGEYLAGREALREQDASAALEYFEDALRVRSDDGVLLNIALQAALSKGDLKRAISLAPKVIEQDEDGSTAYLVLAINALHQKDYDGARSNLEKTAENGFNVLLKPLLMSWIKLGQGNVDGAFAELNALDKYNGFEALKQYQSALLSDVSGDRKLADQNYQAALSGPSGRAVRLVQAYGSYLDRTGRRNDVKKLFDDYIERFPLSPTIRLELAELDAGRPLTPIAKDPIEGAAEALYSAASIIGQERAVGVAATYIYFALQLKPDFPMARMLLAETAEDRDKWQEAFDLYSQINPNSAYGKNAQIRTAWVAYRLGRTEEAKERLEAVANSYPEDIEALVVLADVGRDSKNWDEAARNYGRAIERLPEFHERHWSLFYARGIAYEQSKKWPLAEADLLKSLELQPDHPQVLNYLAYSWVDRNENLEKAKDMLIKAVSLRPRDGFIVDSLGWLYYRLGEYDDAVAQLEKAVSLEAADPTITDHLADAYWRVGRREEARYQWQRALWLDPSEEQIPVIREKLKSGLKDDIKAQK